MPRPVVGLILAGGRSRRMGRGLDKALLFAPEVAAALSAAAPEIWLSLRRRQQAPVRDLKAVRDPGEGPLGGLLAGLEEAGPERVVLAVSCDMPAVTTVLLRAVLSALGDRDAAVPVLDDIPQVGCAAWAGRVGPVARRLWDSGARAPRDLLPRIDWAPVDGAPHRAALRSYDRTVDLADWKGTHPGDGEIRRDERGGAGA